MTAVEVNFDGLVGPTHNYAGLSEGNLASRRHKDTIAYPRQAALQGIAKMRTLMRLGLPQGVLAPQERPPMAFLRALGFSGSDAQVWEAAFAEENQVLRNALAASSMWAANAATISPSADCTDGRVHITPANLHTMLHRAIEAPSTTRLLRVMFGAPEHFVVHDPLPTHPAFGDEGAANIMRLCSAHGARGVEVLVYGRSFAEGSVNGLPARQTLEACRAIFRRHGVAGAICARQSRRAIDAGAFHNDVVAVANEQVLFHHEHAFDDTDGLKRALSDAPFDVHFVEVSEADVPLSDAIQSYLFNAQLLRSPGAARMTLIAPGECAENEKTASFLKALTAGNGPIGAVEIVDLRESMRNGGGPACLRLRVVLTDAERAAVPAGFFMTEDLATQLEAWATRYYRDQIAPGDVADPHLLDETRVALDALTQILPLGADFYTFQRV
jgi:succinylarginine dihydrolase